MNIISKKEAVSLGLKRYYTGVPCKHGHIAERKVNNSDCLECKRIRSIKARSEPLKKNKDKLYRSTDEYKRRKAYNARLKNHVKIIDAQLEKLNNKRRAGDKFVSKSDAELYGLSRYYDGSICKRGHVSQRTTSNGSCCECALVNAAEPHRLAKKKEYYAINKDRLTPRNVERQRERYSECAEYRMGVAARNMLKRVLRTSDELKRGGTYEVLGYNRKQLMDHLESLFTEGMSWDNYGEWHIDHIVPVSWWLKNNITDPSQINDLLNLQPLWADENLTKSNNI